MREIKFRAWHLDAKDMIYFGLGQDHFNAYSIEEDLNYTLDLDHGHPVMQFTGLLDKNGVEIYELMEIDNQYRVIYDRGSYVLQDISNGDIIALLDSLTRKANEREITGEYSPIQKN